MSTAAPARVFLLSPARLDGARARLLFEPATSFPLAVALRTREGAPIGAVFSFLSGLYFRGKLTYATKFARAPAGAAWLGGGALVITQNRGLVPAESRISIAHLEAFAATRIDARDRDFTTPIARDARTLAATIGEEGEAVLLGSVATVKYTDVLSQFLGNRLVFPRDFVGLGDMSRGALLLSAAASGRELDYRLLGDLPQRKRSRRPRRAPTERDPQISPSGPERRDPT